MNDRAGRLTTATAVLLASVFAAGCGDGAREEEPPAFKPVATIDEVMDAIVIPSSQAIFDAVVYSNGELVQAPQSDSDWATLRIHALGVAEAGNLLMMAPRAKDNADWMTFSRVMNDQAMIVAAAAGRKDLDGFLKAGGELYNSCTQCHEKYIPE